jgi:Protein of unknown function (DUF3592)
MRVLKILGIVFGTLLLVTGFVLAVGYQVANVAKAETAEEWANSGYAGPVDATVQFVDQANPVIVTVTYTDTQGNTHTAKGDAINDKPPEIGATVPIYYTTSDPNHVIVDNLLGVGDLSAIEEILRIAAIICLIVGTVILLAGVLGLALGRKQPASVGPGPTYRPGPPQQPSAGYPAQLYPPHQSPGQPYPPQQYLPQPPPGQQYPPER